MIVQAETLVQPFPNGLISTFEGKDKRSIRNSNLVDTINLNRISEFFLHEVFKRCNKVFTSPDETRLNGITHEHTRIGSWFKSHVLLWLESRSSPVVNASPKWNVGSLELFPKTKFPRRFDFRVILDVMCHTPMSGSISPI